MLCDNCKTNPATFHKKVVINGSGYEMHLCSACAGLNTLSPFDIFNLPSFFEDDMLIADADAKKCPTCNSCFSDFLRRGKLGCKDCYATFEEEIRDMLENMESPIDFNLDDFLDTDDNEQLNKLEADFKKAIDEERYEDAGKLKEEINKLKNESNKEGK